jgi:hypothetical protein
MRFSNLDNVGGGLVPEVNGKRVKVGQAVFKFRISDFGFRI